MTDFYRSFFAFNVCYIKHFTKTFWELFNVLLTFSKSMVYYNHKEEIRTIVKERKIKRDAIMIY